MMKWLLPAILLLLTTGCEECSFCGGEKVYVYNGTEIQREELPTIRYCDELLEELEAHPVDTAFANIDSLGQVMIVTSNTCF